MYESLIYKSIQISVAGGPPADIEEVGSVAGGLLALDMSPDCEIITLVTAQLNLILMTRDYTPLSETPIHQVTTIFLVFE